MTGRELPPQAIPPGDVSAAASDALLGMPAAGVPVDPGRDARLMVHGPGGITPRHVAAVRGQVRYRVAVCETKVPYSARTVWRDDIPLTEDTVAPGDRHYVAVWAADDDDAFPPGDPDRLDGPEVWFSLMVTEDEKALLDDRAADPGSSVVSVRYESLQGLL